MGGPAGQGRRRRSLGLLRVEDSGPDGRRDRRSGEGGSSGRGLRHHRRAGRERPAHPHGADGQRGAVADVLPLRLPRTAGAVPRAGRARRGRRRRLPLAHGHRGLPQPHRHRLRGRTAGPLRAGVDARAGPPRVPLVPHRRRRRERGRRRDRRRECCRRCQRGRRQVAENPAEADHQPASEGITR